MPEPAEIETPSNPHQSLSVLRMLWNRRWLVLGIWLLCSVLAAVIARSLPPVYKAEAVVLVDSQKIPEAFVSSTVQGDVADRLALISASVMTSSRLLGIIHKFGLYRSERGDATQDELLRQMHQDITVSFEKNWTGDRMKAFRLGYKGHNPTVVAEVTNRLAGLYVEENTIARETQAEGTVEFLGAQLRQAKKSLDEQEQKVARFKLEHNGTLPEQENSLLGTLNSLNIQLQGIQASVARAEENKLALEASLAAAQSSEASVRANAERASRNLAEGTAGVPRSAVLAEQLRVLRMRYTDQNPDVQRVAGELAAARREEAEQASVSAPKDSPSTAALHTTPELIELHERIASLKAQIEVARHQIASAEQQRAQTAAAIADTRARIEHLPLVEQEMAELKRNYDESAANYNSLLQKQLAAGMATDMERSHNSERFTIIDPARTPQRPESPKRGAIALAGSVAGLVVGLLCGFALEFRRGTLLGEWELPPGTPVLGRVPPISATARREATPAESA